MENKETQNVLGIYNINIYLKLDTIIRKSILYVTGRLFTIFK